MTLPKGEWITKQDIMKKFYLTEAEADVSIAVMVDEGVIGQYVVDHGWPVRYEVE